MDSNIANNPLAVSVNLHTRFSFTTVNKLYIKSPPRFEINQSTNVSSTSNKGHSIFKHSWSATDLKEKPTYIKKHIYIAIFIAIGKSMGRLQYCNIYCNRPIHGKME